MYSVGESLREHVLPPDPPPLGVGVISIILKSPGKKIINRYAIQKKIIEIWYPNKNWPTVNVGQFFDLANNPI
jgi:hypothetical protein